MRDNGLREKSFVQPIINRMLEYIWIYSCKSVWHNFTCLLSGLANWIASQ